MRCPATKACPAPPRPLQPTLHQTRLLNFFGTFANDTEGRDAATTEDRCNFIAVLLDPLVNLTAAKDHSARWWVGASSLACVSDHALPACGWAAHCSPALRKPAAPVHCRRRFCQLVHALVGNLPQDFEPSDALNAVLGKLEEAMLVGGGRAPGCTARGGSDAALCADPFGYVANRAVLIPGLRCRPAGPAG